MVWLGLTGVAAVLWLARDVSHVIRLSVVPRRQTADHRQQTQAADGNQHDSAEAQQDAAESRLRPSRLDSTKKFHQHAVVLPVLQSRSAW